MITEREKLIRKIQAAAGDIPADVVIKNGRIIDVFSGRLLESGVAITDGEIIGLGDFKGKKVIDAGGRIISPALIDSHVHIESSLLTPGSFSDVLAAHGVTTAITDPHEIANVLGTDGIRFMIERSRSALIDIYFMLPSSVPATAFEHNGAVLNAKDLEPLFNSPTVLGLAEVMDFPAVRHADPVMIDKLLMTGKHSWRIDGHGAGLDASAINIYRTAGIRTDHECVSAAEAEERLTRGMYVMIRQGTVAKDLPQLIDLVSPGNSRRFLFCTDDKYPDDLMNEGSVDANIRMAIEHGLDPITCIRMATLNAAECFGLLKKGAVAPGCEANLLLLDDLHSFAIHEVYVHGQLVARDGKAIDSPAGSAVKAPAHPLTFPKPEEKSFHVPAASGEKAHIIGIIPNSLVTRNLYEEIPVKNNAFYFEPKSGIQKIAVIERHKGLGTIGVGLVKGFTMRSGAIATTIAHDSHNLVVTGCSDADMILAAESLKAIDGGMIVVNRGKILASLPLPIAGLMTDTPAEEVARALQQLRQAAAKLGTPDTFNPFLTLSFLSLPVIPDLKLTDTGLFDVRQFKHIPIC